MNVRRSPHPNRGLRWVFVERWKEMFAAQFMQAVMTHWLIVLIPTQQASANLWPTISTQSSHGSEQWTSVLGNLWPLVAEECKTSVSNYHSCIQSCFPSLNYFYLQHFPSGLSFSSVTLKMLVWCIVFRFGRKGRSRAFSFFKGQMVSSATDIHQSGRWQSWCTDLLVYFCRQSTLSSGRLIFLLCLFIWPFIIHSTSAAVATLTSLWLQEWNCGHCSCVFTFGCLCMCVCYNVASYWWIYLPNLELSSFWKWSRSNSKHRKF